MQTLRPARAATTARAAATVVLPPPPLPDTIRAFGDRKSSMCTSSFYPPVPLTLVPVAVVSADQNGVENDRMGILRRSLGVVLLILGCLSLASPARAQDSGVVDLIELEGVIDPTSFEY